MIKQLVHPPGHQQGPCRNDCTHPHCWDLRQIVEIRCAYCLSPIGYDREYYEQEDTTLIHAECLARQVDHLR